MKIICTADIHIGQKAYGKIDKETGLNEREINTIKLLNQSVEYAIDNNADMYLFAGDMYKNNLPSPTLINYVNKAFRKLSDNNIYTLVLAGNHDVSRLDSAFSGLAQLTTLRIPNIIQDRFLNIQKYKGYQFVLLPTYHTKEEIKDIMDNLDTTLPTVIVGHLSINNASLNDWTVIDNEVCIDKEIFNKENVRAVILGHFHKHQVLNPKPLMMYVGSLDRIDFSEENQSKGFVELNLESTDTYYNFIECQDAQKFLTIKVNGEGKDSNAIERMIIRELNKQDIKNAIIRVRVSVDEEIILNEKSLLEEAYANGCQYMLKVQKILPKQELTQTTENNIDNSLSTKEAVEHYYLNQKRAEERIKIAKDIIDIVEGDAV